MLRGEVLFCLCILPYCKVLGVLQCILERRYGRRGPQEWGSLGKDEKSELREGSC